MPKARVVVVDDHQVVREGLKLLIDSQPDMQVIAEFQSARRAMTELRTIAADLILLDLQLGDSSGLEVLRSVGSSTPGARMLVLSAYPETQYALNVLRAGAAGFLSKNSDPDEMLRAMRAVIRGGRYIGSTLAGQLVDGLNGDLDTPPHGKLSAREFQVFCKLAQGESVGAISSKMFLSVKTVSTYRRRVLDKMAMNSNAELTSYAIRNELIQ